MTAKAARAPKTLGAYALLAFALLWLGLIILLPLINVLVTAFSQGLPPYLAALHTEDAKAAILLTLLVAAIAVPLNAIFGICAAWCITRFEFKGKSLLLSILDLPFSISPVISGLVWILLFGAQGWFGFLLRDHDIKIVFALPGLVLATVLVTLPFIARELIPLMEDQGTDEEVAARTLGARGWDIFFRVTLPNIKWALLYGVLLCTARAMGEFGAVSVVSGHIRGLTDTLPLYIEITYNQYDTIGAFAAASILAGLAIVTLVLKSLLEWRFAGELAASRRH
ncbi:sulfate ABC transporter permease subunit CysW [Asticcacaulis benevestitus]|uniref:Sulfate/thiosulfate transporter permease subunit n=1 Tax=Asticcacaulis benevestitus DSM 16100 = ATCC BAA-896 TaxID=1121022 RepID=V4PPU2_9CAUL|nr:sulfate ABC transporter permease subunit CysW [Asticcacaulis benevestitus]ESQ89339.1 sulfate/thiosulfate transporter permease subunit [Asticcacaulis benevestitus DSM 16100 = ATCC BAA-896]